MKKIRGNQRKDIVKVIKTMKMQEGKYYKKPDTISIQFDRNEGKTIGFSDKNFKQRINSEYNEPYRLENYRYKKQKTIEHEENCIPSKQKSVQLTKHHLKQSNSPNKVQFPKKNPYLSSSKGVFGRYSKDNKVSRGQGRRVRTHESSKLEENWRITKKSSWKPVSINIDDMSEQIKVLFREGKYQSSLQKVRKILQVDKHNKQVLYMGGMNELNLKNYPSSLKYMNKILQLDPIYNKVVYLACIICYSNTLNHDEAIRIGKICLQFYPDYCEAYLQLAKVYLKLDKNKEAITFLNQCITRQFRKTSVYLCLAEAKEKLGQFEEAISYYEAIISTKNVDPKIILLKAECEKRCGKYEEYISTLKMYLNANKNLKMGFGSLYYKIGYGYYKLDDYHNAIMNLQQVFKDKYFTQVTETLILLVVIQVVKRDFYEASHVLSRKSHYEVDQVKLSFFSTFCEGIIFLMKKKFKQGLNKLLQLQFKVQETTLNEYEEQLSQYYSMYLAYAYFCEGQLYNCKTELQRQLKIKNTNMREYRKSLQYNKWLCDGLIEYSEGHQKQALNCFEQSTFIYPQKPEGYFYLSLVLIKEYVEGQTTDLMIKIRNNLDISILNIKEMNNNYAAQVYYVKSVFSAYIGEWEDALTQIDQSIQRAEDNISKAFYLRAIILACCQNFKQAISEITIAISIDEKEGKYYLLRSRCLQIEGDGNRAFIDLQAYISLCPEDNQIHKYAGHLLFENGAFEDAIQAYDNGEILQEESNYDVFLTRSKTFFLIGKFDKAIEDLKAVIRLKPNDYYVRFDLKVLKVLHQLFNTISNQSVMEEEKEIDEKLKYITRELQQVIEEGIKKTFGKIYRGIQLKLLEAVLYFYQRQYRQAIRLFKETIILKEQTLIQPLDDEQQFEEQQKQKYSFIAQMNYNMAVCHLTLGEEAASLKKLKACQIQEKSKTYEVYQNIKNIIQSLKQQQAQTIDLFSQKNKMSKLLSHDPIKLKNKTTLNIRLCVPFPKVQPPQINPKFDRTLLSGIELQEIERKPEAPWIIRQQNTIKFTDKVENYSKLDMNFSQISKESGFMRKNLKMMDPDISSEMNDENTESLELLKQKLRLDDKIERKLHKILKDGKN